MCATRDDRTSAEQRDQREDWDDAQILKQQHREHATTMFAVHFIALGERGQRERGRRHRECDTNDDRRHTRNIRRPREPRERAAADDQLHRAESEHRFAQRPQAFTLQLKADQKQQQRDAEFSGLQHGFGLMNDGKCRRPNQHARSEVAKHRSEAQFFENRDEQDGGK